MSLQLVTRYVTLRVNRQIEQTRLTQLITYGFFLAVSLGCASLFWLLGRMNTDANTGTTIFIVANLSLGLWGSFYYTQTYRPNSARLINKMSWLWLETIRALFLAILITGITALPFYLGRLMLGTLVNNWQIAQTSGSIIVVSASLTLVGIFWAMVIRQITKHGVARLVLLILSLYLPIIILIRWPNISQTLANMFSRPTIGAALPIALLVIGCLGLAIFGIEQMFKRWFIAPYRSSRYWPAFFQARPLHQITHPLIGYYITSLLYYWRDSRFHQRLIVLLAVAILLPIIGEVISLSDNAVFFWLIALIWLTTFTVALPSSQRLVEEERLLQSLPQSKIVRQAGSAAALTVVMIFGVLYYQLAAPRLEISSLLAVVLVSILLHLYIFNFSLIGAQQSSQDQNQATSLIGLLFSLVVILIPAATITAVSTTELNYLLAIWIIGSWLIVRSLLTSRTLAV